MLKKTPSKKCKTKKIVKFEKKYDVRPFSASDKTAKITQTKSIVDSYKKYHFS